MSAYEMRISDWSSDVCSSDLPSGSSELFQGGLQGQPVAASAKAADHTHRDIGKVGVMAERFTLVHVGQVHFDEWDDHGQQRVDRKSVVQGESGPVRVDLCWSHII